MNLIKEINDWLTQTLVVKIKVPLSENEFGIPTYTSSTILCRYEDDHSMKLNVRGQTIINNIKLYTRTKLTENDLITINSVEWKVLQVKELIDEKGTIIYYYCFL